MRLTSMTIENFRCYHKPITITFEDITTIIGRNDVGKSTIMDALSIFFEITSLDKDDASKQGDVKNIRITCEFNDLPASLIVDTDFPTTLADELLVSNKDTLIIQKAYNGSLASPKLSSVSAIAHHPSAEGFNDLLSLKRADLVKRCNQLGIDISSIDKRANAPLRKAL